MRILSSTDSSDLSNLIPVEAERRRRWKLVVADHFIPQGL